MKNAWRSVGAGAALILLLTVVAYVPTLRGGFVFDDLKLITGNRMVKASDGLHRFWFTAEAPDYRPLTWSLWWLEWRVWDGRATGYHVVNVLLHAVNCVLVWMILRRLKIPGAWLAAVVFAVHPVNVATGAWISEQKNTLSMLFYALAILLYLRFDEEGRWRWYSLSLAAGLLALLSKTAVVMLPVVLLGCVWWLRGRVRWKDWLCSVPYFVASLVLAVVTVVQHQRGLGGTVVRTGGFAARLVTAGWVPWFYLYKALLPFNLTVFYPRWEVDASRWVSYVPGMILIGCLIVFWWKRETWGRPLLFGLGYFVVMLFPVLGFFDQNFYRFSLVADHWQYHPIVGVIALAVAAGQRIANRLGERGRSVGVLASVVVLTVLGVATWRRGRVYADGETLWQDNVTKNPNAWVAHNNLGTVLMQAGKLQDAIGHYEQALRIGPDDADVHYNLGATLWQVGRVQEAIGHYERALQIKPDYVEARNNLGLALYQAGRFQEATRHYEQALRIKPDYADAHYNLGVALVRQGKLQEAVGHWEQALRYDPDDAEAHHNLGNALLTLGKVREAIGHYERALQIKPDYVGAQNNLAWLLATLAPVEGGDPVGAVNLAERACRLTSDRDAACLDTLAVAYAAAGRFDDAIATAQKAAELARSAGQSELVGEIEARLQLYRDGRPYREPATAVRRQSLDAPSPHSR